MCVCVALWSVGTNLRNPCKVVLYLCYVFLFLLFSEFLLHFTMTFMYITSVGLLRLSFLTWHN